MWIPFKSKRQLNPKMSKVNYQKWLQRVALGVGVGMGIDVLVDVDVVLDGVVDELVAEGVEKLKIHVNQKKMTMYLQVLKCVHLLKLDLEVDDWLNLTENMNINLYIDVSIWKGTNLKNIYVMTQVRLKSA